MNFAVAGEYPGNPSATRLSAKSCMVAIAGNVLTIAGGAPAMPEVRLECVRSYDLSSLRVLELL